MLLIPLDNSILPSELDVAVQGFVCRHRQYDFRIVRMVRLTCASFAG